MKYVSKKIRFVVIASILAGAQPTVVHAQQSIESQVSGAVAAEYIRDMFLEINSAVTTIVERGRAIINPNNKDTLKDHMAWFNASKQTCTLMVQRLHAVSGDHKVLHHAEQVARGLLMRIEAVSKVLEQHRATKDPITFGTAIKDPLRNLGSVKALKALHTQLFKLYTLIAPESEATVKLDMEGALVELEDLINMADKQKAPNDLQMVGILRNMLKRS